MSSSIILDRIFLIFPKLSPRYRFIAHRLIAQNYQTVFQTRSFGQSHKRIFVVYLSELVNRLQSMADTNTDNNTINEQDDWDSLFDDSGNTLDKEIITELNKDLKVDSLASQFSKTKLDYKEYEENDQDGTSDVPKVECGNILEIYNFSPDMKTSDLQTALSSYGVTSFDIDWVDETHALAVYPNNDIAQSALLHNYVVLKLRPLSEGINKSKIKADKRFDKVPTKVRPQTTNLLARRLVASALGIKDTAQDKEKAKLEREKIRLAKEKKQQLKESRKNIWDD